jgi:hypothetical protein
MRTLLISAALVLAAAGAAFAQGPGGMGGRLMAADANKDGVITKAEFDANRTVRFAETDKNKDGFLSKDEMAVMMGDRPGGPPPGAPSGNPPPNFGMARGDMDANKDGKISKAEFLANDRMFVRLDANKDGKVDKTELDAMRARVDGRGHDGKGSGG